MRSGLNILLALSILGGFSCLDMARAEGDAAATGADTSKEASASQTKKPRLGKRIGNRFDKIKGRFHKKPAAPAAGGAAPADAPKQ
jgi:hypothetical protein